MIGYLSVLEIEGRYSGGLLVVDERGIPSEFKYTEPITPTKIQKIIYGKALKKFIYIEVIGKNLVSKSETKPQIILTDLMELTEVGENVFFITRVFGEEEASEEGEYIIKSPISSYRILGSGKLSEDILKKISDYAENYDLLEPFDRLKRAIEYICGEYSEK